jgi:HSF-type DNA-binding
MSPTLSFLSAQLMEILDDPENADVLSWLHHGRGFVIYRKKAFEQRLLPKYFNKQSKYSSFTRKLNRWGFSRVTRGPEGKVAVRRDIHVWKREQATVSPYANIPSFSWRVLPPVLPERRASTRHADELPERKQERSRCNSDEERRARWFRWDRRLPVQCDCSGRASFCSTSFQFVRVSSGAPWCPAAAATASAAADTATASAAGGSVSCSVWFVAKYSRSAVDAAWDPSRVDAFSSSTSRQYLLAASRCSLESRGQQRREHECHERRQLSDFLSFWRRGSYKGSH